MKNHRLPSTHRTPRNTHHRQEATPPSSRPNSPHCAFATHTLPPIHAITHMRTHTDCIQRSGKTANSRMQTKGTDCSSSLRTPQCKAAQPEHCTPHSKHSPERRFGRCLDFAFLALLEAPRFRCFGIAKVTGSGGVGVLGEFITRLSNLCPVKQPVGRRTLPVGRRTVFLRRQDGDRHIPHLLGTHQGNPYFGW